MMANGNSFGDGEGTERTILSGRWMFPGQDCGVQEMCNRP